MATQGNQIRESMVAGADLSSLQFTFVKQNTTDRQVISCDAGEEAFGVLINEPESGNAASVVVHGRVLIEVGSGGISAGDDIASDANGKAVTAATGDYVLGKAIEDVAASGRGTVDIFRGGNVVA